MNTAICPLCGGPNQCGMAAGQTTCWCTAATIPAEVLDRIPSDQRNQTCLCRACAQQPEQPDSGGALRSSILLPDKE